MEEIIYIVQYMLGVTKPHFTASAARVCLSLHVGNELLRIKELVNHHVLVKNT